MTAQRAAQPIPLADQIAEVERELTFRRRRWPGNVSSGHFDANTAYSRINRLEAALATLKALDAAQPKSANPEAPTWPNR